MVNNETHDKHSFQGDLGLATKVCTVWQLSRPTVVQWVLYWPATTGLAEETGPSGVFSHWFKR